MACLILELGAFLWSGLNWIERAGTRGIPICVRINSLKLCETKLNLN